jgi:hypothetical protein
MTERVVKVYPKQEQLESSVKGLENVVEHLKVFYQQSDMEIKDIIKLVDVEINRIKSLYESNT